jgi:hypothetical protein
MNLHVVHMFTMCFILQLDNRETCINFTLERWFPVANMSRYLPIRVYDFYAPGKYFQDANLAVNIDNKRCLNFGVLAVPIHNCCMKNI